MSKIIIHEKLEEILLLNWANFMDRTQFLKKVLEDTRNADLSKSYQQEIPPKQIKLSVTKMEAKNSEFEIWAEFSIPHDPGIAVGTHVYSLQLSGELILKQTFGHVFVLENN